MTSDAIVQSYQFFVQKQIGGYHTPDEVQLAFNRAQNELFADRIGMPEMYQGNQPPPSVFARTRRLGDSLQPFKLRPVISLTNGVGTTPTDYYYLDTVQVRYYVNPVDGCESSEPPGVLTYRPVYFPPDENEWALRTSSEIDTPTFRNPIARFITPTQF